MKPIKSPDNRVIEPRLWPARENRAIVQILHGLSEHIERYGRFAIACNRLGISVIGHNHRGHGASVDSKQPRHFAERDGWSRVVDDAYAVFRATERENPSIPIILLGHSMGSYIAQSLVMRKSPAIHALLLSGSGAPNRMEIRGARWLAGLLSSLRGREQLSLLLNKLVFQGFNRPFAPNRTSFDWLSRDELEVDRYKADPLCGGPASNGLWVDLFGGLLEVNSQRALASIPSELPILISGGAADPAGGEAQLKKLANTYQTTDHSDVTLKIYPDARHELLNETNRDAVTADWLQWIEQVLANTAATPADR